MYVCLCNPVTESEVRRCVREGARTLTDLQACLGVALNCGSCAEVALSIVEEESTLPRVSCPSVGAIAA